ncbi:MAG: geranyl transferase [SAR86 cluster bacterium]|uniref:Geranyl transferase n=1 Tax=SAR86 cluster bacterium TaxID=2030880 RepID=A0A2A5B5M6_9GAMM|nr:MAG: geranyl transferase [SAR86 cluster bacterium]
MTSENSSSLNGFLEQCQQRVNKNLTAHLQLNIPGESLRDAMEYACLGGGKRIRPVLVYGAVQAVGGDIEAADYAACAIELIHSYSLVHDDLPAMDDDDLRRGKATVHKAYDEATAILVGDALQALAFQLLSAESQSLSSETRLRMVHTLSQAAGANGMVGGQSLDFEAVGVNLNLQQLEQMHNLKTGALIQCAVRLGGMSHAQTSADQLTALDVYAANIGLAFQVQDDILDEISDTKTLGKPQGSDRQQNKPTYVSLMGLEAANEKASDLANSAISALDDFSTEADELRALASYIIQRLH